MVMTSQDLPSLLKKKAEMKVLEWLKCKRNLIYFVTRYVYLQDRALRKTVKFSAWRHLLDLLKLFVEQPLLIILKARQLGISWLLAAYAVWLAKFHENVKVLFLSQGEEEAFDLIGKCKFIDNHLPDWLHEVRDPDAKGHIGFSSTGSEIKALPSTEKAGRSTDASLVVCDEWEFHPYAKDNFAALKPTIDGGGQFIGVSTADKTKKDTFFKEKYMEARAGTSNFMHKFLSWRERPGRDDEWYESIKRDMKPHQVEQEYPNTEEEALETLKTRKFFLLPMINMMYGDVSKPMPHELTDRFPSIRIYKLPEVGKKYLVATDPSEGREDPHVSFVINSTGEQVAESCGKTTADQCALIHDTLVRFYNDARNTWESGPGGANGIVTIKLEELKTPNRCPALNVSKLPFRLDYKSGKKGWWASKTLWNVIIQELEEAVRLRLVIIRSKEAIDEFRDFIVPEGEEPQKTRGGSDNYIDAIARVWHLRKYQDSGLVTIQSTTYQHE